MGKMRAGDYIVFLGSGNIDAYYTMDKWPEKGAKEACVFEENRIGGMIANAASTAAAYGLKCYCLDVLGTDADERAILDDLANYGIDNSQIVVVDGVHSTRCEVFVHRDERTILVVRNKEGKPKISINDTQRVFLHGARFLYSGFEVERLIENSVEFLRDLKASGVRVAFDVEPTGYKASWRDHMRYANIVFFNEFGFERFREGRREEELLRELFDMGVETVVITLGSAGCRVISLEEDFLVPIFEGVEVVDTTGAGDTFNSSFVSARMMGMDLKSCARFATAAANMAVMTYGPRGGVHSLKAVLDFMETHSPKSETK